MKKIILSLALVGLSWISFNQIDRSKAPAPQPNPEIKINIPDAITVANGMKVIVVENHKLPKVSFQLYIDHPTTAEGEKAGIGQLFSELLACGTTSMSKDDFDKKIDFVGASVYTNPRGFFASSLKKHTPVLLGLLSDMILNPAFPEEDFNRLKDQTLSNLASIQTDANTMSSIVSSVVNYGENHPYGQVTTEETIGAITLDDIRNYYKTYFIPNYAYLVIVGDVTQAEAQAYVDKYFAPWKKGEEIRTPVFNVPAEEGNNVYFVDKPGAVQSVINITHTVDLKPGHPDEIPLRILNGILGGGSFSARLMANLREDKAYTYGCYSSISSDQLIGVFSAGGSFRNEVTDSAIVQILFEIKRIATELVTDSELKLMKSSITGAFGRSLENPETVARFALNTIRYGLPKDYYTNYLMNLEKVTKEDLLRVAQKYLRPENLNIVVVGNSDISNKLSVFDSQGVIALRDYYGRVRQQLKAVPDGVTLQSVLNTYIYKTFMVSDQAGLDARLKKIGFIQTAYKGEIAGMEGNLFMTTYKGKPNKTASISKVVSPGMTAIFEKSWFNGTAGGSFALGQGSTTFEGDEITKRQKTSFPIDQMYYLTDESMACELMGIDEVKGVSYYKVKVGQKDSADFSYEYYNVETGLLEMNESFTTDEEGNSVTVIVTYSDFKDTGSGMFVPYTMELNTQGQVIKFTVTEMIIKKKAKSGAFEGQFD